MQLNPPAQMHCENVPPIPENVGERVRQYMQARSAFFCDWHPGGEGMLISTRFGQTYQLHQLRFPGGARKQVTFYDEPLYGASFCESAEANSFAFSLDIGGGENYQIFYFDLDNGQRVRITDGESRNGSPLWNHGGTTLAFSSTRRNGRDHDIHLADIRYPESARLVCKVQGMWVPICWSPDNQALLLMDYISATETHLHLLDVASGEVEQLFEKLPGGVAYGDACWSADGAKLYFVSDLGGEFMKLQCLEFASSEITTLSEEIPWNVSSIDLSPDGSRLVFSSNEDGLSRLYLLDTASHDYLQLPIPMGVLGAPKFSPDGSQIGFTLHLPNHPADVWSLRLADGELLRWTESEVGGLNTSSFPVPDLIRYETFDGMQIPAFYFRPKQSSTRAYPVIISIHGGPESQYHPSYSALFQYWLNELDIAVIAPNVRGSTGYGKKYITLDNGYLREDSVKDIGALLDWIKAHPELDEKRVCVYGGSYGGYMVLASLTHYSDRLRCGIDMVGISNFVTFLKNTKSYRRDLRRVEYGDERDPDMCAFLESISPTTNAHKITRPLFVAQGLNDPRVPVSEAEQIVKTVRDNGQEVWYLMARDEGHGFHKQPNIEYYYNAMSLFLETHLLD